MSPLTGGWCRVALAAVVMLPVLLLVLLSAPAWIAIPLLPEPRGRQVAAHLEEIRKWHAASVRCLAITLPTAADRRRAVDLLSADR